MLSSGHFRSMLALFLAIVLLLTTTPVVAEDISKLPLGSLGGVGRVQLRGVDISQEGTLFAGDHVRVGEKAFAKVGFVDGNRLTSSGTSDFIVRRGGQGVEIEFQRGNIGFMASKSPLSIKLGNYELLVKSGASGDVGFVGTDAVGVRVTSGSVTMRHLTSRKTFTVSGQDERLFSLVSDRVDTPIAQLASAVPLPIPAPASVPQAVPGARTTRGQWVAVLATVAGAATAIALLAMAGDDDDNSAAGRLAAQRALQNLSAVAANAQQVSAAATAIASTATQVAAAVNAANLSPAARATLLAQASQIQSAASGAASRVASLTGQVSALQTQIQNQDEGPTAQQQQQLNQLLAELRVARDQVNDGVNLLNSLLSQAQQQNVGGLPSNNTGQVGGPTITSASEPSKF